MFTSPMGQDSSRLPAVLDITDKVVKILAVAIGGGWTYLNYVRGRTFKKRLEPKISGSKIDSNGISFLSGSAQIKNVGLSKFPIEQRGTAILIFDLQPSVSVTQPTAMVEVRTAVRSVFKNHGWIEPGETIEESFLLQLPEKEQRVALKLELRVVAAHIEWNANCVVGTSIENASVIAPPTLVMARQSNNETLGGEMASKLFPRQPDPDVTDFQIKERPEITDDIESEKDKPEAGNEEQQVDSATTQRSFR
jgi:hypothetical protein